MSFSLLHLLEDLTQRIKNKCRGGRKSALRFFKWNTDTTDQTPARKTAGKDLHG